MLTVPELFYTNFTEWFIKLIMFNKVLYFEVVRLFGFITNLYCSRLPFKLLHES